MMRPATDQQAPPRGANGIDASAAEAFVQVIEAGADAAYTGAELDRLNRVNIEITNIFNDAGFEPIEPSILQPADPLFDLYGEEIRERAFFVESGGEPPLCLRPDFTVPVARAFLEGATPNAGAASARFGYFGPVFRTALDGPGPAQHLQAGVEIIGEGDPAARDAEAFDLACKALKWCGCDAFTVVTGDLNIMFSLLDAIAMPEVFRKRLKRHFWRPARFHQLIRNAIRDAESGEIKTQSAGRMALLRGVGALGPAEAAAALGDVLALSETPHIGVRSQEEVIQRLAEQATEARERPLSREAAALIETVLSVRGACAPSLARLRDLCRAAQLDLSRALDAMGARLDALSSRGIDVYTLPFDASFGHNLEYYDGFVFEMRAAPSTARMGAPNGAGQPERVVKLGGGGRYDRLFRKMQSAARSPLAPLTGVGVALRPEAIVAAADANAALFQEAAP